MHINVIASWMYMYVARWPQRGDDYLIARVLLWRGKQLKRQDGPRRREKGRGGGREGELIQTTRHVLDLKEFHWGPTRKIGRAPSPTRKPLISEKKQLEQCTCLCVVHIQYRWGRPNHVSFPFQEEAHELTVRYCPLLTTQSRSQKPGNRVS